MPPSPSANIGTFVVVAYTATAALVFVYPYKYHRKTRSSQTRFIDFGLRIISEISIDRPDLFYP
jgi:hypothetical protein